MGILVFVLIVLPVGACIGLGAAVGAAVGTIIALCLGKKFARFLIIGLFADALLGFYVGVQVAHKPITQLRNYNSGVRGN